MKKNLKLLSSLALAGVLATNVMGLPVFAATTENTTKTEVLGIYQKLVEGRKNVVPFVLANTEDRVTIQDIKNSGKFTNITKFNGLAVPNEENTVVCTGDTFTANQKEYTVVVYGDVNQDGAIDVDDAVAVQKNIVGTQELDAIQQEAADVKNDQEIDVDDAVAIKKYIVGNAEQLISPLPEEETEESSEYSCKISVNDNDCINTENEKTTKIGVKLSQTYEKPTTLTVKVLDEEGEEITVSGLSGNLTINQYTDYVEKTIDFSDVSAQYLTIQLLDEKGAIAGTVRAEINRVHPQAALVSTNRTSTTEATMSFLAQADSDIVRMYYVIVNSNENVPAWNTNKSEFTGKTTKVINIENNQLENVILSNELERGKTYQVYYVLENSYGSRSEVPNKTEILSDTINSQIAKVETIHVPDLSQKTTEFTWEAPERTTGYVVTIYKDGNIISEESCTDPKYDVGDKIKEKGAGKYQISVVAKGDGIKDKNSEVTQSGEIEIKALRSVSNIAFEIDTEGKSMLSWTDSNTKEDVKEYQINLYKQKENGKFEDTPVTVKAQDTKKEIAIDPNVFYKAEVIAVAQDDGQVEFVDSTECILEGFYKIETKANLGNKVTENSVNLTLDDVKVNGKSATYKVKVYLVKEDKNPEKPELTFVTTKDVVYQEGEIVIDGLESNTLYAFKLIANVDGIQGESNYIKGARTLNRTPEIRNLTVVKNEKEATVGTIYKNDADTLIVNGEKMEVTSDSNYSENFKAIAKVIGTLHANDVVTIEGETIKLTLPSEASSQALDLGIAAKDMTVVIEGNGFEKTITATQGSEPKEVTLKGNEARFDVSGLHAKKIMLTNGVIVTGNQEYTVAAGTSAVINGVKVTTQKETTIHANGKVLNVTANKEMNHLVFENLIAENITQGPEATIQFIGEPDLTSKQLGTITIKTEDGKVTVAQQNVNVSSTLNVEVNTGEVVVNDVAFTGNKNIMVTNKEEGTAIVQTIAKTKAPIAMTNVALKDYTEEEFEKAFPDVTKAEEIKAVREFMDSFGINGKGANITVAKNSNEVTITFTEPVTNLPISGIK